MKVHVLPTMSSFDVASLTIYPFPNLPGLD
jgi:hypothetical protein